MNKRSLLRYVGVTALAALLLAATLTACGNKGGESPTPRPVSAPGAPEIPREPDYGGSITLSMRNPLTLNPLLNEDETVAGVLSLVFENLFILDARLKPSPNPALIESSVLSNDAKTITLTMRDDIYWHSGERITAADVAFSIEYLRQNAPDDAVYKGCVSNILSTAVTGNTIRINMIQPYAQIGYMLVFPIIPQYYYKNADDAAQMAPVGSGPYAFVSYNRARELMLTAAGWPLGAVYIEHVKVIITTSDENDINAFAQGITDALAADMAGLNKARAGADAKRTEYISQYFDFVGFNFDNPVFSNRDIRAAIAHCLPIAQLIENIYNGAAIASVTPINPVSWLYDDAVTHQPFDTARAAALLEGAGYNAGAPLNLRILVNAENTERVGVAQVLEVQLAGAGVATTLDILPWDDYIAKLTAGEFDVFLGGYKLSILPDLSFLLHSSSAEDLYTDNRLTARGANLMHYRDDYMDKFLAEAFRANNDEAWRHAFSELQNYIAYDMPIIGIAFRKAALYQNSRVGLVTGSPTPRPGDVFSGLTGWFVNYK